MTVLALVLAGALQAGAAPDLPGARPCTLAEIAALTAPAPDGAPPFRLACQATLPPGAAITRRILIEGAEASGAGLDCAGGALGRPGARTTTQAPTVAVWSRPGAQGWSPPTDVFFRDCTIHGAVRIWGMGAGVGMSALRDSSRTPGHTEAAQDAAPRNIRLTDLTFVGTGSVPLYVGPGVRGVLVERARFSGVSDSVAIYLDAESAGAAIVDSRFDIRTEREQIAVDGSAHNLIARNRFELRRRGGVFLYRNCGEDGVIRHQAPTGNTIVDNDFDGAGWIRPNAVVVGSREGRRRYCGDDAGWRFGSSADDGDRATGNTVARNTVRR